MDFLDNIPYVSEYREYAVPLLLLVLALVIIRVLHRVAVTTGLSNKMSAGLIKLFWPPEREAARLEKKGELEQAAMLFRRIDLIDDAVRCYQKMDNPVVAGQFLENMEKFQEAEKLYKRADSESHLRCVWSKQGKWDKVAESLLADGKRNMAAEAFEKAGMPSQAAQIYITEENFDKAGRLFREAGENAKAAAALEKAFINDKMFAKEKPETAALSAQLYVASDLPADAARMYVQADMPAEAAHAFEKAGNYTAAGENYHLAKEHEKSAECFRRAGDQVHAASVMAEFMENKGRLIDAGELYRQGDNPIKAAELFEAAEKYGDAAECYKTTGEYTSAGECFIRAGQVRDAAVMFQQAGVFERASSLFLECGEFDKAIDIFEKSGRHYDAGMLLSQLGKTESAMHALKNVRREDEHYRESSYLLGNLLMKRGLLYEAAEAYRSALIGDVVNVGNLGVFYSLATALEETGRKSEANEIFRQIMVLKPDYRDVRKKLDAAT